MENAGDLDQFASLIRPNCQPTDSQEEKLQSCHFLRESEVFPGVTQSVEASEQATEIRMVSLPESSDDYQTPPEHHRSSQNSSNDGQVPPTKTAALDREAENRGVGNREAMMVDVSCEQKDKLMVDLTKDSDNLHFLEISPRAPENIDTDLEDNNTLMVDGKNNEQIEVDEDAAVKTNAENCVAEAIKERARKVFVEMPMREKEVSPKQGTFIDTLNRALKILPRQGKRGAGGAEIEDGGDGDFFETAKQRGLTLPRPRWWPPEGGSEG